MGKPPCVTMTSAAATKSMIVATKAAEWRGGGGGFGTSDGRRRRLGIGTIIVAWPASAMPSASIRAS